MIEKIKLPQYEPAIKLEPKINENGNSIVSKLKILIIFFSWLFWIDNNKKVIKNRLTSIELKFEIINFFIRFYTIVNYFLE